MTQSLVEAPLCGQLVLPADWSALTGERDGQGRRPQDGLLEGDKAELELGASIRPERATDETLSQTEESRTPAWVTH
jgi:hypothetical protein